MLTRIAIVAMCAAALSASGCSVRNYALGQVGDALAASGSTFGADDDPELIRAAAPFSLKLMESVLAALPEHPGLLRAVSGGFAQYAYAFVQLEADERESQDIAAAKALRARARALYERAGQYGMRALAARHPGFAEDFIWNSRAAIDRLSKEDASTLYWATVAQASVVSLSKDSARSLAKLRTLDLLVERLQQLDPDLEDGALHTFLISYEMAKPGARDAAPRARTHFERAVRLSGGRKAAPYVAFAENVCVATQDRRQFAALLEKALAIDPSASPQWRLENAIMQRRARWLLSQIDQLFLE